MDNIRASIIEILKEPNYRGLNKIDLSKKLELGPRDRSNFRTQLAKLERAGIIIRASKGKYYLRGGDDKPILIGQIRFSQKGHGTFFPDLNDKQNLSLDIELEKCRRIHIPHTKGGVALDGDIVTVQIDRWGEERKARGGKQRRGAEKGRRRGDKRQPKPVELSNNDPVGRVVDIIKRRNKYVVGTYFQRGKFSYFQPEDHTLPESFDIIEPSKAKSGQMVAVEIVKWTSPFEIPQARVNEILGWPGDVGIDMLSIVFKNGIKTDFPPQVSADADAVPHTIDEDEVARRDDWRERLIITIDPADAKDYDDAIAVEKADNGNWLLAVHIADVSHYVKPGSPLDEEARYRGNSTYLADRVIPMLPPVLSDNMCSLRGGVDRLTKCCVMEISPTGDLLKSTFSDAIIHSKARMSYEEAQVMLEGDTGEEIGDMVRDAWQLASMLRKNRFVKGALDLDFPEVRVKLDEKGVPVDIIKSEHNESHKLIEEFMLLANEATARLLKGRATGTIYRIHEDPDADKLMEFSQTAATLGFRSGDLTNRKHIQSLLKQAKGTMEEHAIKLGLLKSLKRAAYGKEPLGHYGLNKGDYCHFTSPIRRYADLIVHRSLERHLSNPPAQIDPILKSAELDKIGEHISNTERTSAAAENESQKLKMMEYLYLCTQKEEPPIFKCVVIEARRMGIFVEAIDIMTKGLIRVDHFPAGDWLFDSELQKYTNHDGMKGSLKEIKVGQKIDAHVARVDIEAKMIDFKFVQAAAKRSRKK
ncbi:ribonuclease R [Persicirhabdus sediminis]|uniref:Ribonuclease R n=1 Tax=Persicirhabdus sediminis TaxID=454144 RepID=A0A8J7MCA4_9BACT|nr:ribonuclease R [Persicirhabdus sediminis]MBK1789845.1 ribonuclease R [Persicirhabdus sediminis]